VYAAWGGRPAQAPHATSWVGLHSLAVYWPSEHALHGDGAVAPSTQ
jgi:hypothetical protein